MICQDQEPLIAQVCQLYDQISSLKSLSPSHEVNTLFTKLVLTCMPPNPIDVSKLCSRIRAIRSHLIHLCGLAEGLLESHFSLTLAQSYPANPLHNLHIFPYYNNYLKLSNLEYEALSLHFTNKRPSKIAFLGSGPLPLTSIVLAQTHLSDAAFHNYDLDPEANSKAEALVATDPELSKRMFFHTKDVVDMDRAELGDFDVVFLAALVGVGPDEKASVLKHLASHMGSGALLVARSAHGARAFLYPVVEPRDLKGFEVLSVYHPTDEVINSVVVARKLHSGDGDASLVSSSAAVGSSFVIPTKCCHEIQFEGLFNPRNIHGNMVVEELTFEDKM